MLSSPVSELDFGTLSHLPELSCTAPPAERLSAQSAPVSEAITAASCFQGPARNKTRSPPALDQPPNKLSSSDFDHLQPFVFSFVLDEEGVDIQS